MSRPTQSIKRSSLIPFALTACLLVFTPACGSIKMFYTPEESIPDTFVGSSTEGGNVETAECPVGTIAIGVMVHSRRFFTIDAVSGLQLFCATLSGTGAMSEEFPTRTITAGRASGNDIDRYPRICPTGQALAGLRGRAGRVVDAISIRCGEFTPNVLTGSVDKGETHNIGEPIFGSGGDPDQSTCNGNTFVRSIRVEFGDVADRIRTFCAHLDITPLGNQNARNIDVTVRSNNQRIVFNGITDPDSFSVFVHNLGRDIPANTATVEVIFDPDIVAFPDFPQSCTLTPAALTLLRCPVSQAIARGGLAQLSGFSFRPLTVLDVFTEAFTVDVIVVLDGNGAINSHREIILAPGIFFP